MNRAVRDLRALNERRDFIRGSGVNAAPIGTVGAGGGVADRTGKLGTLLSDSEPRWESEEAALVGIVRDGIDVCHGVCDTLGVAHGLALEYRYVWDLQVKQVARMLGVCVTTVRGYIRNALVHIAHEGIAALRSQDGE